MSNIRLGHYFLFDLHVSCGRDCPHLMLFLLYGTVFVKRLRPIHANAYILQQLETNFNDRLYINCIDD